MLLALSYGLTVQIVTFSCFAYLVLMSIGILPYVITRSINLIRLKQTVCVIMGVIALTATVLKSLVMIDIDGKPIISFFSENYSSKFLQFFGLQGDQSV